MRALYHGDREIVSRLADGAIARTNYRQIAGRARSLAGALVRFGLKPGERAATLAWNTAAHMECWYGIAGMGGVYHTLNPRLFPDQIAWIANHAEDRVLFFDASFADLVAQLAPKMSSIELFVALTGRAHLPEAGDSKSRRL